MNFMTPCPELLSAALSGVIKYEVLKSVVHATSKSAPEVVDALACYVANEYARGAMTFENADTIMNAAFAIVVSEEFWDEHDRIVPKITLEVYQAFDAGEYHHRGDAEDVDPEKEYTRPQIERFLSVYGSGA